MNGDGRIDEIAAQRAQPRQRAVLVGAGQAAEADDVGGENRGEFADFTHDAPLPAQITQLPARVVFAG